MLFNLLNSAASAASDSGNGNGGGGFNWPQIVLIALLVVVIVVFMVLSRRSQKKKAQETQDMLDAIQPGNKVKTIGGICGVVVEVCPEDNTFVLETGTEASGKSYLKFDKQAVYQTDAVARKPETNAAPAQTAEETKAEEPAPAEAAPVEEAAEAPVEAPVEEAAETTEDKE